MILTQLARETRIHERYLIYLARSASHRYKIYHIPKKTGGFRQIAHPSKQVKFLQRWLAINVFAHLPVHGAALAYRKNINIADLAHVHSAGVFFMMLDFVNFFPSFTEEDVYTFLKKRRHGIPREMTVDDCELLAKAVTRSGALPIGAPSSPQLSNAMMFDFDEAVASMCAAEGVTYTRYADDMQFSTQQAGILNRFRPALSELIACWERPRLTLNEEKSVFTSKKHWVRLVGLIRTPDGRISVGRANKRRIKTLVFRYSRGWTEPSETAYLKGYLSFVRSVEPEFVSRLVRKFGPEVMESILSLKS